MIADQVHGGFPDWGASASHDDNRPAEGVSDTLSAHEARLAVFGIGGGGCNAVNHMIRHDLGGVEYLGINTDQQALKDIPAQQRLAIGHELTGGLGAGANPNVGYQAAEESADEIRRAMSGLDMVFIAAGMGGGTGTGAAPAVARMAREMGILTVGVVTKPFKQIEGHRRANYADQGIKALSEHTDSLIVIANDLLLPELGRSATLLSAFGAANDVLHNAVAGIARMITRPGLINIDFADVKTVMSIQGNAKAGTGRGTGENRALEAAQQAISNPLLEQRHIRGAQGVLVNISGGHDIGLGEFNDVGEIVREIAGESATVVIGTSLDESLEGQLRVSVVASGLPDAPPDSRDHQESRPTRRPQPVSRQPAPHQTDAQYLDIPAFLRRDLKNTP